MRRDHERRRPWSLYSADGEWLGDVDLPESTIRATLPGAVVCRETGTITLQGRPSGTGVLVPVQADGDHR